MQGWYDSGMKIWGGENIELSLKVSYPLSHRKVFEDSKCVGIPSDYWMPVCVQVWMCGGRVIVVPCSRIGHIFKSVSHGFPDGFRLVPKVLVILQLAL